MKKADVMDLANRYSMVILRDSITHEARGVYCDTDDAIPELDALANKVDWHNPAPGQVVVERQNFGSAYRYIIHCPTSWFDLWGWREDVDESQRIYRVIPKYWDDWFWGLSSKEIGDATVTEDEIKRLAREWSVTVEDLLEQVEEI